MRFMLPGLMALLFFPTAARADRAAADACAATLNSESKIIYEAMLPVAGSGQDMRQAMTSTTTQLAISGKIQRATARDSAQAAGACLQKLR